MKNLSLLFTAFLFIQLNTLAQISEFKLLPSDGAQGDRFGNSVSISGDYAVVGAYRDDDNGNYSGSAYIFRRDGTNWIEEQKLTASDGEHDDLFGNSVSISGDYAIVGAYNDASTVSAQGSAYIFNRDGTNWTEEQKLTASDGAEEDWFGTSVSISGDYIIIGAFKDDNNGSNSGSSYIYSDFVVVDVENEKLGHPLSFSLHQNYPNPFNPSTKIKFVIPKSSFVNLKVYDVLGNEVAILVNEEKPAGSYEFEYNATALSSGIYFYNLQAGNFVETKKMVLMK